MDIKTDTPLVKKAREGVMEFLLVCTLITMQFCLCSVSASCNHLPVAHLSNFSSMLVLTSTASTSPFMHQVDSLGRLLVHFPSAEHPDSALFCRLNIPLIAQFVIKVEPLIAASHNH